MAREVNQKINLGFVLNDGDFGSIRVEVGAEIELEEDDNPEREFKRMRMRTEKRLAVIRDEVVEQINAKKRKKKS